MHGLTWLNIITWLIYNPIVEYPILCLVYLRFAFHEIEPQKSSYVHYLANSANKNLIEKKSYNDIYDAN